MKIMADLHIHSPYSMAVSKDMSFKSLEKGAVVKGLDVIGTGDFTHPKWRQEIRSALVAEDGFYRLKDGGQTRFMITGEVCTTFELRGKIRRIHHLILLPSVELAEQLSEALAKRGKLESDGRPNLAMNGAELAEEVVNLGENCMIIPAHIWTPWFSLFGSRGGVDCIEDCYDDQTPHIYALETGLSSDPPMNWRLRALDRFTLVSNSDSHSPSPWRIGRETNLIEVPKLTYPDVVETIMHRKNDVTTIEVDPAYGKYHWTGHRDCKVSFPPAESIRLKGICPVCGRRLTIGVAERVEQLADREEGEIPNGVQKFIRLLPLSEVIATVLGKDVFSASVQEQYWRILKEFSNEFNILLDVPIERLIQVCGMEIAETIIMNRENRLEIDPGYDGVYGKPKIGIAEEFGANSEGGTEKKERFLRKARNLEDY
jgi:uncharacterized protein (TIGR00375 family)